jgi:hypothetical protein
MSDDTTAYEDSLDATEIYERLLDGRSGDGPTATLPTPHGDLEFPMTAPSRAERNECLRSLPDAMVDELESATDDVTDKSLAETDFTIDMLPDGETTREIEDMVIEGLTPHPTLADGDVADIVHNDCHDKVVFSVWGDLLTLASEDKAITEFRSPVSRN